MADAKLNKDIYNIDVTNHELVKLAYDAYLANSRTAHAKTLKRGEVRGGGKKPWRQKGTGRARFGSTRNPIWRHGGIAFGPTGQENFTKTLSKSAKHTAIRQALSMAHAAKKIETIPAFEAKTGKTKDTVKELKLENVNNLLVVPEKTESILRATKNIASLRVVRPTYLTVYDILNADRIIITEASLPTIETWLIGKEK
jgi:large subunit ribosomal protein L4